MLEGKKSNSRLGLFNLIAGSRLSPCPRLPRFIHRSSICPILLFGSLLLNTFALAKDFAFPWGRSIRKARIKGLQNGIPGQPGSIHAHVLLERDFEVGLE